MTDAAPAPDHDGRRATPAGGEGSGFPSIIIQGEALARIEAEMSAETTAEHGGVLVGNAAPSTNFVLIAGSLAAPQPTRDPPAEQEPPERARTAPAGFTISAATLEQLTRQVGQTYPGQRIVGWYHSHPRTGIFLTADDLSIQGTFFHQPWQVGYVFDSVYGQRGFFGWSGPDIVRVPHWEITTVAHAAGADLPVGTPAHTTPGIALGTNPAIDSAADPARRSAGSGAESRGAAVAPGAVSSVVETTKRPMGAWIAAAVAVMAIVVAAVLLRDDDDGGSTGSGTTSAATPDGGSSAETVTTDAAITAATDVASTDEQTTIAAAGESSTTGAGEITLPVTPTAVQTPASRVANLGPACEQTAANTYEPLVDCFVPLNNGNIMLFVDGSLRCVDPDGQVVAAEAQRFTIGNAVDPLVLIADDLLTPTCLNLAYAQNVLVGGSTTFDGLCGGFGIQINDATRRCFAQNPTSGAMVAVVRANDDLTKLVSACTTADAQNTVAPITWSAEGVGSNWHVDLVTFDSGQNQFVATATRNGETATATFGCG